MILKRGLTLTVSGVAVGIAGSFALTRFIESLLFGVGTSDISIMSAITVILIVMATGACLIPARRAARIDPIEALRVI